MYQYSDFDRQFVQQRSAQFRDQLERWQSGKLAEEEFRPLRLQNGWYVQRYAPMLRVAVPYGELSANQVRTLAKVAREYDEPEAAVYKEALDKQGLLGTTHLPTQCAHFTTRQNVQFNWIPLSKSADVMDLLASANMHGIQTSGNVIRNITSDELAGIAVDEVADPRPFGEIMRQWSTLHPEFSFLPRKFKIAITGAAEDRAAIGWHDVGLQMVRNAENELGFRVYVGGGMGRTPAVGILIREFLPWNQIMNYLEAIVRVYNRWGRRDNLYKARIKILVKAEGQRYVQEVEEEFKEVIEHDGGMHLITQQEYDRVAACFVEPPLTRHVGAALAELPTDNPAFSRWLERNVMPHRNPNLRAVRLSFKRLGWAPGDADSVILESAAHLAEQYSAGELRVTHTQNLLLPWVHVNDLFEVWQEAKRLGLASATSHLFTDMITCPGGDFCALANARSLPISQTLLERYQDLDELYDLGPIDLHISGCINSCGHHHSGHIGILGVDKDGKEWYQVVLGGSDGSDISGPATAGKVIGPSFSLAEVPGVIEAILETYKSLREHTNGKTESFIETFRRVGMPPFKEAGNSARIPAKEPVETAVEQ